MRRLLRVNLSNGAIKEEDIRKKIALDYVGGRGFGSKYLYDEVPADVDPLGKQNKLLLGTGLLAAPAHMQQRGPDKGGEEETGP